MIFYFSGTGNSMQAAKNIAECNQERLISIAAAMNSKAEKFEYTLGEDEVVGFVYPVYAWAPPKIVLQFIDRLKFNNYKGNFTFSVATCGDDIGNTMKVLDSRMKRNGLHLDSCFSVRMPNNYIIGFDVDTKELEQKKLSKAEETLDTINKVIQDRKAGVFEVVRGALPGLKTSVINPLFNSKGINTKKFYANDNCNGCGICEIVCSCRNIKVEGKPKWGENCTQCLACLHFCPVKAIQYGKGTARKGRYRNPNVTTGEIRDMLNQVDNHR